LVRNDGAEARKQRIQEIIKGIASKLNQGENVFLSSTVVEIQYGYGLTQRTANEYIEIGEKLQRYKIDKLDDRIKQIGDN